MRYTYVHSLKFYENPTNGKRDLERTQNKWLNYMTFYCYLDRESAWLNYGFRTPFQRGEHIPKV